MSQGKIYIYGKHAVGEALAHARPSVLKVLLSSKFNDQALRAAVDRAGVATGPLDERALTSQVEGRGTHQGVVALVSLPMLVRTFDRFVEELQPTADTLVVLLSEVQDPHNVGAIIRSAAAFGAAAILLPTRGASPVTGAVVKASAGMAFRIPLVATDNVQQSIAQLKKRGFRAHGLSARGHVAIGEEPFDASTLLMLGNEGVGLPPAAAALCDNLLTIPMDSRAESLNVAASAAVALYAWSQKHPLN